MVLEFSHSHTQAILILLFYLWAWLIYVNYHSDLSDWLDDGSRTQPDKPKLIPGFLLELLENSYSSWVAEPIGYKSELQRVI